MLSKKTPDNISPGEITGTAAVMNVKFKPSNACYNFMYTVNSLYYLNLFKTDILIHIFCSWYVHSDKKNYLTFIPPHTQMLKMMNIAYSPASYKFVREIRVIDLPCNLAISTRYSWVLL